ncbi:MAG: TonB-dependent receptor, partial [candidate division WOR-3 bacterium]
VDSETHQPLPNVNITIPGTGRGTSTDRQGLFYMPDLPTGRYQLKVSLIGYQPQIKIIVLKDSIYLNFELAPEPIELTVTEVTAKKEKIEDSKTISGSEIKRTAGGGGDLFRAIQKLPGISPVSDFSGIFVIRGGDIDEVLYLLDRGVIFNPFHFFGLGGMFDADMIDQVDIFTGGFSAEYNWAMSGIVSTRLIRGERWRGKIALDLANAKFFITAPNIALCLRRSWFDILLEKSGATESYILPNYYDLNGNFVLPINKNHKISSTFLLSEDNSKVTLDEEGATLTWWQSVSHASVAYDFNARTNLLLRSLIYFDYFPARIRLLRWHADNDLKLYVYRQDIIYQPSITFTLKCGYSYSRILFNLKGKMPGFGMRGIPDTLEPDLFLKSNIITTVPGLFIEAEQRPNYLINIRYGIRGDYFKKCQEYVTSPRIMLSLLPDRDLTVFAAYGIFYQFPRRLEQLLDTTNFPRSQKATHYILGTEWNFLANNRIKIEVYYKDYDRLITSDSTFQHTANDGYGYARGIEIFLQREDKRYLSGWFSYSFLTSYRKTGFDRKLYRADWEQPHTINLSLALPEIKGFTVSTNLRFASGKPYTPLVQTFYDSLRQCYLPVYGEKNSARTEYYSRLDLRLEKRLGIITFYGEAINLLNRKNIENYEFDPTTGRTKTYYSLPFIPLLGISANF